MLPQHFRCLLALARERHIGRAAQASGLSRAAFLDLLDDAGRTYGRPLVSLGDAFEGFTPLGEVVLSCARRLEDPDGAAEVAPVETEAAPTAPPPLAALLARRSVSPKRLAEPGPSLDQLDLMLQAALRAPDHGGLRPWRVIEFRRETRAALAEAFEQEKRRRDPLASEADLRLAREHAVRAPALLGFVVSPQARAKVPMREQHLAAGAALGNLLQAAHGLGFGAIMLSGERCFDEPLLAQLGIARDEFLAGFVSIGTIAQVPPRAKTVLPGTVWSCWTPARQAQDAEASDDRTLDAEG